MEGDAHAKWDVTGPFLMQTPSVKAWMANRLNLSAIPAWGTVPPGSPCINQLMLTEHCGD